MASEAQNSQNALAQAKAMAELAASNRELANALRGILRGSNPQTQRVLLMGRDESDQAAPVNLTSGGSVITGSTPGGSGTTRGKVLAQLVPAAATLTDLYTVPGGRKSLINSVTVCNQNAVLAIKFRLSVAIAGAADNAKQYLYFNQILTPENTFLIALGLQLNATDVIRCRSDMGSVSFNVNGEETSL